jgi:hypothetical protein
MTPQEEAKDLIEDVKQTIPNYLIEIDEDVTRLAKEFSLLAVDKIITAFELYGNDLMGEINYWNEVKKELKEFEIP